VDEYTGFAKWGLLWVLLGLAVWVIFFRPGSTASPAPEAVAPPAPPPRPPPPRIDPDVMRTAAAAFVDDTFPHVEPSISEELRPSLFLYLCAQVTGAYRVEYLETLTEEESEAFANHMWNASLARYEERFGAQAPREEDDFDPEAELAEWWDDCLSLWSDFIERGRDTPLEQAWLFALRNNYFESQAPEWVAAQTEVAVRLARRLPTLSHLPPHPPEAPT